MRSLHAESFAAHAIDRAQALTGRRADRGGVAAPDGSADGVNAIFRNTVRRDRASSGRLWSAPTPAKLAGA
ncbi:MAG TPA: hypothetical protein PKB14_04435 [Rubrivivax sp.]|nr:hypothetical protein [Rubrivivax sp.]